MKVVDLKSELRPDLIFTHCRDDRYQDHRLVCELTWNARKLVLAV